MRAVDTAREGLVRDLPGLTSCLAPLANKNFDPVKDGKPPSVNTLDELLWDGDKSRHYLLSLFQYRTMVACYKANRALRHSVEIEKLSVKIFKLINSINVSDKKKTVFLEFIKIILNRKN